MTFGTARDLSLQVVTIPMTSFRLLMNSPHSEFQRISPQLTQKAPGASSDPNPAIGHEIPVEMPTFGY
jgi:hypothetical protein